MNKLQISLNDVTVSGEPNEDKHMVFSIEVGEANPMLTGLSKRRLLEIKDAISIATMRGRADA